MSEFQNRAEGYRTSFGVLQSSNIHFWSLQQDTGEPTVPASCCEYLRAWMFLSWDFFPDVL